MTSVLYLYEFTLLSNVLSAPLISFMVLYLYEFTLLSNDKLESILANGSYTSMNLHYSQTLVYKDSEGNTSYTSMNLHYSQTTMLTLFNSVVVLYLYEFTLLSNMIPFANDRIAVLYLYEFTLLSNLKF